MSRSIQAPGLEAAGSVNGCGCIDPPQFVSFGIVGIGVLPGCDDDVMDSPGDAGGFDFHPKFEGLQISRM